MGNTESIEKLNNQIKRSKYNTNHHPTIKENETKTLTNIRDNIHDEYLTKEKHTEFSVNQNNNSYKNLMKDVSEIFQSETMNVEADSKLKSKNFEEFLIKNLTNQIETEFEEEIDKSKLLDELESIFADSKISRLQLEDIINKHENEKVLNIEGRKQQLMNNIKMCTSLLHDNKGDMGGFSSDKFLSLNKIYNKMKGKGYNISYTQTAKICEFMICDHSQPYIMYIDPTYIYIPKTTDKNPNGNKEITEKLKIYLPCIYMRNDTENFKGYYGLIGQWRWNKNILKWQFYKMSDNFDEIFTKVDWNNKLLKQMISHGNKALRSNDFLPDMSFNQKDLLKYYEN